MIKVCVCSVAIITRTVAECLNNNDVPVLDKKHYIGCQYLMLIRHSPQSCYISRHQRVHRIHVRERQQQRQESLFAFHPSFIF